MKYYILASRPPVGDCALFWRPVGKGYTTNLGDAGLYSEEDSAAIVRVSGGETQRVQEDWLKRIARRHVDWAELRKSIAAGQIDPDSAEVPGIDQRQAFLDLAEDWERPSPDSLVPDPSEIRYWAREGCAKDLREVTERLFPLREAVGAADIPVPEAVAVPPELSLLATRFEFEQSGFRFTIERYDNHGRLLPDRAWCVALWHTKGDLPNVHYLGLDGKWRYKVGAAFSTLASAWDAYSRADVPS